MSKRGWKTLPLVGIVVSITACHGGEWVHDYEGYLPGAHPAIGSRDAVHAVLVVDARTGQPLAGVRARLYLEDTRPEAFPGTLVADTETDEYGFAWLRWRKEFASCHWLFDLAGYAPHDELGAQSHRIELEPGHEVRGRLNRWAAGFKTCWGWSTSA